MIIIDVDVDYKRVTKAKRVDTGVRLRFPLTAGFSVAPACLAIALGKGGSDLKRAHHSQSERKAQRVI